MSSVGKGAVLVNAATNASGVAVAGRNGRLVGVGRIVPVGVGKTGWKGVGVGWKAGWKGVDVGLAFGLAVTNVKGRDCAAGAVPQAALTRVNDSKSKKNVALLMITFIGLCPAYGRCVCIVKVG
jgi:hypothetical protein